MGRVHGTDPSPDLFHPSPDPTRIREGREGTPPSQTSLLDNCHWTLHSDNFVEQSKRIYLVTDGCSAE